MEKTQRMSVIGPQCHYNNQTCVGGFIPTVETMFRTNSPHGLSFANAYFFGTFRDDENGLYVYIRHVGVESLHEVSFYYKAPGKDAIVLPDSYELFRGMGVNRRKGDEIRIRSYQASPGPPFSLVIDPNQFNFSEKGRIELSGKRFGLAMNVFWPQGGQDQLYSATFYEAEGTILDRPVKGGMFWNQAYGPPGENWQTMRVFAEPLQGAWVEAYNFYDNGEKEAIEVAFGKGDWGWLFATVGDQITSISRTVKAEVEWDEEEYPKRVLFRTPDAGDWEWVAEPDCHLNPKSFNLPFRWVDGVIQRVGEQRKIIRSGAWIEAYPDMIKSVLS